MQGAVSDALNLMPQVDGALYVVKFNTVKRKSIKGNLRRLKESKVPVYGAVLNQIGLHVANYYTATYDKAAGAQAKGLNLLSDKDYPAAIAALKSAIALNPHDRDARYYLLVTHLQAKQYPAAAAAAEDLITRYPKFWGAWFTLGFVHFEGKLDPNRGIAAMRTFLQHAENPRPAQRASALACTGAFEERLGHADAARTAFQQALALNGDDKNAKEGLARIPRG